ncbi:sulfate permease [Salinisphaera sp. T5B8]
MRARRLQFDRLWAGLKPGGYPRDALVADLLAALVVTTLLIPQALAYALLAGMPPETGLYASMLPLVAYAIFGRSRALAVGPFAVVSIMTAAAAAQVAAHTDIDSTSAAITLALLSGVMLIAMGTLRLGFLINFLSRPVIYGFIAASGVLIAASQFGRLLGVPASGQTLWAIVEALWQHRAAFEPLTVLLAGTCLAWLIATRWYLAGLLSALGIGETTAGLLGRTGPILLVLASTAASAAFDFDGHGIATVGKVTAGLPALALPLPPIASLQYLWLPALLISIVTFAESVSMAQTLAGPRNEQVAPNRELAGLGAANMVSALSGAFPVSASLSRSVVNDEAGARTRAAGALTAVGVAASALFLMPLLAYLPLVTLSCIIIVAVQSLIGTGSFIRAWRYSRQDGFAQLATFAVTLILGVSGGLMIGVALSLVIYIYRTSKPHYAIVGLMPNSEHFRNVRRHGVQTADHVTILRIDESLYFGNARFFEQVVDEIRRQQPGLTDLVLMCPAVNFIDYSALESLELISDKLARHGVRLHLAEVKGPVMDRLQHTEFLKRLNGNVFLSTYDAWRTLVQDTPPSR